VLAALSACYWPDDQLPGETSAPASIDNPTTPEYVSSLPAGQSRPVVNTLANEAGLSDIAVLSGLSRDLPDAVDELTPTGAIGDFGDFGEA